MNFEVLVDKNIIVYSFKRVFVEKEKENKKQKTIVTNLYPSIYASIVRDIRYQLDLIDFV